jgi:hypothetical protein
MVENCVFTQPLAARNSRRAGQLITTNEEVRRYSSESHAILAEEWRMGFWQWIEDTIEMKDKIPEIEEEDYHPAVTNGVSR